MLITVLSHIALIAGWSICVEGHGRLVQPPSRSTMWRFGYSTPHNYNDNQLFCGGSSIQWGQNGGKCGVCGDRYDGERENEAPNGKYATGTLVAKYDAGQMIEIKVHITANHKGWFEYRLCRNDDPKAAVTQTCFDENLLADETGKTRFTITSSMFRVAHKVKLPNGLKCKACVIQWKYNTGNSWGKDFETGKGCIGCGPQEQFYGCADVAIGADDIVMPTPDKDVTVPDGDVDEREEIDKTDEYDSYGGCKCNCALTSSASRTMKTSTIVMASLCSLLAQVIACFK